MKLSTYKSKAPQFHSSKCASMMLYDYNYKHDALMTGTKTATKSLTVCVKWKTHSPLLETAALYTFYKMLV